VVNSSEKYTPAGSGSHTAVMPRAFPVASILLVAAYCAKPCPD
jgi:hypothetical protein